MFKWIKAGCAISYAIARTQYPAHADAPPSDPTILAMLVHLNPNVRSRGG